MTSPPLAAATGHLGPRFVDAVGYAAAVHADQTRKGTTSPYVSHLLVVAGLVLEAGGDEDTAIAALLHDAPEDRGGARRLDDIRHRFGDRVALIVAGCSDSLAAAGEEKADYAERKRRYIDHLNDPATLDEVLLVAAADKTHNAQALVIDADLRTDSWERFNGTPEQILGYYRGCLAAFRARGVAPRLVALLSETVDRMTVQVQAATAAAGPAGADG